MNILGHVFQSQRFLNGLMKSVENFVCLPLLTRLPSQLSHRSMEGGSEGSTLREDLKDAPYAAFRVTGIMIIRQEGFAFTT
jgi:hypothetical protein